MLILGDIWYNYISINNSRRVIMNEELVKVRGLIKFYNTIPALKGINLDLPKGKIIGLLGPNGCGKTTFLKILSNLLNNYQGEVLINGQKPGEYTKSIISYLPDRNYLSDNWTGKYAIQYFSDFYPDFDPQKAVHLFKLLKLDLNTRFKFFSKGNKEKMQLILVLSRNAKLYLFDEPIAGVDPAARDLIFDLILKNYNKDATVIISTHLVYDVEKILDYAIFMSYGEILRYDTIENLVSTNNKTLEELFKEDFKCFQSY